MANKFYLVIGPRSFNGNESHGRFNQAYAAQAEAKRLSEKHVDAEFFVLEAIDAYVTTSRRTSLN